MNFLSQFYFLTPMDYNSPWSERKFWLFLKANKKEPNLRNLRRPCTSKLVCMHFTSISTCMNFLSQFHFLTPMDYSPWSEGKFWLFLKAKKGAKSPNPERPCTSKLVCMHFMSTSTCMNFLSQFYFLTPMDYSPWSEGKFWPFCWQMKNEPNLQNQRGHAHQNWFACILH